MDIFDKCRALQRPLAAGVAVGAYPYFRALSTAQEPVVLHDGREMLMLGSNNYLGLANHPEVKRAAARALERYGTGCAGSRLLNGTLDIHVELEEELAAFLGRESALTFATGFQVNLGVLSCLLGRGDVALLDALDHACILDGARLGFGRHYKFQHNDVSDLERRLAGVAAQRAALIVVDGVFSMEGDLAPLPEIAELAGRYGARLMVDDAHALGVFGERGRGTPEHFDVEPHVDLVMGTFSKSLATVGGFVAGEAYVIDHIKHHARTQIFSAAPPPASVAAALAALEIVEREPERRKQLWENTELMRRELRALGFDTGSSASPIVPLRVGDVLQTFGMAKRLHEEGVFVNPVVSPAVPAGRSLIRTSYMASHERQHLERALEAFRKVGREMWLIP